MEYNGEFIKLFEEKIAKFTGAKYAIAVDSGTNAIFLCIKYLNYKGIVDIPKRTYMSIPMAIINAGCVPRFRDVMWNGLYKLNPLNIYDACSEFYPNMYQFDDHFYILSFQEKKILSLGKGGMILTNNKIAAKILRRMAFDGRNYLLGANEDNEIIIGYHMNMTPDQATKGILKFNQLNKKSYGSCSSYKTYRDLSKMEIFKNYV